MDEIRLELVVPADPRVVAGVRLLASGLSSEVGLDLDAVEDVRMAVGELMSAAIEATEGGNLELTLVASDSRIELSVTTTDAPGLDLSTTVDELATMILDEAADDYRLGVGGGTVTVERLSS